MRCICTRRCLSLYAQFLALSLLTLSTLSSLDFQPTEVPWIAYIQLMLAVNLWAGSKQAAWLLGLLSMSRLDLTLVWEYGVEMQNMVLDIVIVCGFGMVIGSNLLSCSRRRRDGE